MIVWRPYRQDTIGTFATSDSALSKKYETLRIPYGAGRHLAADDFPSFPSCTTARLERNNYKLSSIQLSNDREMVLAAPKPPIVLGIW